MTPDGRGQEDNEITFTLINSDTDIPASGCCFLDAFMLYIKAYASQGAFHFSTTCPLLQCCVLLVFRRNKSNNYS